MRRILRVVLACSLLSTPAAAFAQAESGSYAGVRPGAAQPPPASRRLTGRARRGTQILTWPGFQMREGGGSRFFVQTTGAVTTDVRVAPDRVEVRFPSTTIHLSNSGRWLETAFFETPVSRARLERRGRDMVLVLHLRAAATPTVTSAPPGADGFAYTYIDFAPGRYVPEERAAEPAGGVSVVSTSDTRRSTPASAGGHTDSERPPSVGTAR